MKLEAQRSLAPLAAFAALPPLLKSLVQTGRNFQRSLAAPAPFAALPSLRSEPEEETQWR